MKPLACAGSNGSARLGSPTTCHSRRSHCALARKPSVNNHHAAVKAILNAAFIHVPTEGYSVTELLRCPVFGVRWPRQKRIRMVR